MSITTETEGREDCPVIEASCIYYAYQCDRNGEIAICFCSHEDNPNISEGNCSHTLCPLVKEIDPT